MTWRHLAAGIHYRNFEAFKETKKQKNKKKDFKLNQQVHISGSKGGQSKKEKPHFFWNSTKCGLAAVCAALCGPVSDYLALIV